MDLARLELTRIWSKGPMYLAFGGVYPCPCPRSSIHGTITGELSASRRLSYSGVCARLCAIYLRIQWPRRVSMHDTTNEWRSEGRHLIARAGFFVLPARSSPKAMNYPPRDPYDAILDLDPSPFLRPIH